MASLINALLATAQARTLGDLAHDLMRELEEISGLDSIFLARVDPELRRFEMIYTRNLRPDRVNLRDGTILA